MTSDYRIATHNKEAGENGLSPFGAAPQKGKERAGEENQIGFPLLNTKKDRLAAVQYGGKNGNFEKKPKCYKAERKGMQTNPCMRIQGE